MQVLDDWLAGLLSRIEPKQRRVINRKVAFELRRSQAGRIAAQQNPDGSAYAPRSRSKNLRSRKGSVRRKAMFARLRTQRYLKVGADADGLDVSFRGRAAVIALVHQYGDTHTSSTGQKFVTPKRELLGLRKEDLEMIVDSYVRYIS